MKTIPVVAGSSGAESITPPRLPSSAPQPDPEELTWRDIFPEIHEAYHAGLAEGFANGFVIGAGLCALITILCFHWWGR